MVFTEYKLIIIFFTDLHVKILIPVMWLNVV